MSSAKGTIQRNATERWLQKWLRQRPENNDLARKARPGPKCRSVYPRNIEVAKNRLILGHSHLKDHMNRIYPNVHKTPNCDCGQDRETPLHIIEQCPNLATQRNKLIYDITKTYNELDVPLHLRDYDSASFLGLTKPSDPNAAGPISRAMGEFLGDCIDAGKKF